jgi:hypothetical protein
MLEFLLLSRMPIRTKLMRILLVNFWLLKDDETAILEILSYGMAYSLDIQNVRLAFAAPGIYPFNPENVPNIFFKKTPSPISSDNEKN